MDKEMKGVKVQTSFIEEISKNTCLKNMSEQYRIAFNEGKADEFLSQNPDFIQMMMNLAQDERIEVVYEDEDLP